MIIELGNDRYQRFAYPAGELQVRFTDGEMVRAIRHAGEVTALARIRKPDEIIELALLVDAILGIAPHKRIRLVLPYLPYARADRRFSEGDCHGIATMAKMLFSMSVDQVVSLDVHSPEAEKWIVLRQVSADSFIEQAVNQFAQKFGSHAINVLLPDAGAVGRYKIPTITGCNTFRIDVEIFNATKKRDAVTGTLSGFEVPQMPVHPTLIVDDICDGGGTFIGIAEQLPFIPDLALYTTHGIYSRGLQPLAKWFKQLYTTNSFKPSYAYDPMLTVMDCIPGLLAPEPAGLRV